MVNINIVWGRKTNSPVLQTVKYSELLKQKYRCWKLLFLNNKLYLVPPDTMGVCISQSETIYYNIFISRQMKRGRQDKRASHNRLILPAAFLDTTIFCDCHWRQTDWEFTVWHTSTPHSSLPFFFCRLPHFPVWFFLVHFCSLCCWLELICIFSIVWYKLFLYDTFNIIFFILFFYFFYFFLINLDL